MTQLKISIGAMSPPLSEQLSAFDIKDKREIELMEKDVDALLRVRIRGLIPRAQALKGEQKLFNKIAKLVEKTLP